MYVHIVCIYIYIYIYIYTYIHTYIHTCTHIIICTSNTKQRATIPGGARGEASLQSWRLRDEELRGMFRSP